MDENPHKNNNLNPHQVNSYIDFVIEIIKPEFVNK